MASSDVAQRCSIPYNLGNRIHFFELNQKLQDVVLMPCHVFQNFRAPYEYSYQYSYTAWMYFMRRMNVSICIRHQYPFHHILPILVRCVKANINFTRFGAVHQYRYSIVKLILVRHMKWGDIGVAHELRRYWCGAWNALVRRINIF